MKLKIVLNWGVKTNANGQIHRVVTQHLRRKYTPKNA